MIGLAAFSDDEFGIVAAQAVAEWARITGPIGWKKEAGTISAPFLADNFPAFLLIYSTQHCGVGGLADDPGVGESDVVALIQRPATGRWDTTAAWLRRGHPFRSSSNSSVTSIPSARAVATVMVAALDFLDALQVRSPTETWAVKVPFAVPDKV